MLRKFLRIAPAVVLMGIAVAWVVPSRLSGQAGPMPSTKNGEWPMYTADLRGSKYSPLDQITGANFTKLEVAWTFKTDNLGPAPEAKLEGTPIMVKGTVYATGGGGSRRSVVALDGKTGTLKWVYNMDEGERASRWSPRKLSGRGVSYWTDGKGDERIVYVTVGYRLIELNAKTGQPVASFGENGVLDLKKGVVIGKDKQIDLEKGEIGLHSTPTVVGDVIIVGSSMAEGLGYTHSTNSKGLVRAFDAKTGKQLWRFNTIPKPGEFGNDTWLNGSWEWTGNVGVWTQISVDPEAGLVYLPVETPTIDEYGGNRPGNNLFAESIVAVDLKTGVRKWHFQQVHHGLWDHDNSSASLLVDATVDGRPRKLLAQPTKQGYLYVLDRITGQPIWPIPEVPVPQTDVPGEWTSPTQPIPSKPPAYSRPFVTENDLIDFTPALRNQALENLKRYRWAPTPFIPPAWVGPGGKWAGSVNMGTTVGGVNWPGSAFDPETGIFYTQANNSSVTTPTIAENFLSQVSVESQTKTGARVPIWEDPNSGRGRGAGGGRGAAPGARGAAPGAAEPGAAAPGGATAPGAQAGAGAGGGRGARGGRGGAPGGAPGAAAAAGAEPGAGFGGGGGRGGLGQGLEGLSILKPPYGVITAIDLNTGTMKFQVPNGDGADATRATLQRLGINYTEKLGQGGSRGVLVTKTMVVVGDAQATTTPEHPAGAFLRAYDKQTGKELGIVRMPSSQSGSPMTYMVDGRQYIIVACSGVGNGAGQYVAFALPPTEFRPAGAQ